MPKEMDSRSERSKERERNRERGEEEREGELRSRSEVCGVTETYMCFWLVHKTPINSHTLRERNWLICYAQTHTHTHPHPHPHTHTHTHTHRPSLFPAPSA